MLVYGTKPSLIRQNSAPHRLIRTNAGLLTDEEIINDVTGAQEDHDSDEESCEEVQPRPHRTSREVSEALLILEDVCLSSSDSLRAVGHLEELRKIVMSAGICAKKQTTITKYFSK